MTGSLAERLAGLAVLGALPWPLFAAVASRQYWVVFPRIARILALLLLGYAAILAAIVLAAPLPLFRAVCAAGLILLAGTFWYGRDALGRSRGWPPGSLRPFSPAVWFDRNFFLDHYRRLGSPFKCAQFVRPMACLTGLAEGFEFLRVHEASLRSPPLAFGRFIPGGFLRHMDPDRHAETKAALRSALVPEVYRPLEPFMRGQVRAGVARMVEDSAASAGAGIAPRRYLQGLVFDLWARLFFDIQPGSDESKRIQPLFRVIDIRNPLRASDAAIREALNGVLRVLEEGAERRHSGQSSPPQSFLEALRANSVESAGDPTVIGNLVYLMHTTWADVSSLFSWLMRLLTENPEWIARLRDADASESRDSGARCLATRVVMETLRLAQSEYVYRVAVQDIPHKAFRIPRGWLVRVCVAESHRDPAVFDEPERFNPERFLDRSYTRRQYSPFGAGLRHVCLGEDLTMMAGRIFVEELARGCDWKTVADGPSEYSAWRHWRPSSRWRVQVGPVT